MAGGSPSDGTPSGQWPGIPILTGLVVTAAGWFGIRRAAARYPSVGDGRPALLERE